MTHWAIGWTWGLMSKGMLRRRDDSPDHSQVSGPRSAGTQTSCQSTSIPGDDDSGFQ